jgi:hypothetical protein
MALALSIIGTAFAAVCVWLGVRIFNRRERWAKRTLAVTLCLPLLYVASFGPACWLADKELLPFDPVESAFIPIVQLAMDGPEPFRPAILWYASICGGEDAAARMDGNLWWERYGR